MFIKYNVWPWGGFLLQEIVNLLPTLPATINSLGSYHRKSMAEGG